MQSPGKIEDVKKKIHARARKMLQHGLGNFFWTSGSAGGTVYGSREKFSWGKRTSETLQGTWLCYAGLWAEKQKSGIAGKRHRPKPIPWEKNNQGN